MKSIQKKLNAERGGRGGKAPVCRTVGRSLLLAAAALTAGLGASVSVADELGDASFRPAHADYAMGVRRFRLEDGNSKVLGWQLGEHWYFGKWRGEDKGFGFVWQGDATQVAITDEGINFRRRVSLFR